MSKKTASSISGICMGFALLIIVFSYMWQLPFMTSASIQMSGSSILTLAIVGIGTGMGFSDWRRYRDLEESSINTNRGQE